MSSKDVSKRPSAVGPDPTESKKSQINLEGSTSQNQVRSGSMSEGGPGAVDVDSISAASRRAAGMLTVSNALTSIFIGTEIGQVVLADWLRNKDGTINQEQGQRGKKTKTT